MTAAAKNSSREKALMRLARLRKKRGGAAAHNKRWNEANREKYLAHKAVYNAIRSKKMNRHPCEVCGASDQVHAHHTDYSKPLDVNWLCALHHKQAHVKMASLS